MDELLDEFVDTHNLSCVDQICPSDRGPKTYLLAHPTDRGTFRDGDRAEPGVRG